MSMEHEAPTSWAICELDDVLLKMSNGANVTQYEEKVGYPICRIETIWNEGIDLSRVKYIKESAPEFVEKYALQYGDILLSHINSDSHLGKTGLFKKQVETLIHGINILLLRPVGNISPDFLNYQLKHLRAKGVFIDAAQRAVNQSSINQKKLKSFRIVIASLPEQHRIVAKIEELFSELDKGIENLKTAQVQLKVYRQALLKHAFEGKLTAQWRTENQGKLETADALLKRIQQERTQRYQQQLAEWGASGKQGSKPKAPKSLPPLTAEELAEVPEGWIALSVENIFDIEDGDRGEHYPTKGDFSDTGYCLFLNAKNVTKRGFAFQEMSFISEQKHLELRKGALKRGDIVFTSRGTLGNIAHYNDAIKHEHVRINSGMFIIRDYDISLTPDFLYYHLNAPIITSQIEKLQSGTAQPQLPIREFKSFRFVIPGKAEQLQIVQELEAKLSEIDQLELTLTTSLQQAEALRQSILKRAFSGQLVTQDPHDEPASALLARIRAEKSAQPTSKKVRT